MAELTNRMNDMDLEYSRQRVNATNINSKKASR